MRHTAAIIIVACIYLPQYGCGEQDEDIGLSDEPAEWAYQTCDLSIQSRSCACPGTWTCSVIEICEKRSQLPSCSEILERKAIFDYLRDKTLEREAFSPPKNAALGLDYEVQSAQLEPLFIRAFSNERLFHAILRMSTVRADRHLRLLEETDDGQVAQLWFDDKDLEAPVQFMPDFSDPSRYQFFVADVAAGDWFPDHATPTIGDRVLSINGRPIDRYTQILVRYLRYSTSQKAAVQAAKRLTQNQAPEFPSHLYNGDSVTYEFQRASGEVYELTVPYVDEDTLTWTAPPIRTFPGFEPMPVLEKTNYALHRHAGDKPVLLLRWLDFEDPLVEEMEALLDYAQAEGILDYDVIIDATDSSGGSGGPDVLKRLSPKPFQTTLGNVRISDISATFAKTRTPAVEAWIMSAVEAGQEYTSNAPFKLQYFDADEDGIMQPNERHFSGRLVFMCFPDAGSQLDQFAAMIIDNKLGYSLGMTCAGHSNTWEYEEMLISPRDGRPLVGFMWNIGDTIRPNGEVLEGNPAVPEEFIPMTAEIGRAHV